MSRVPRKDIAYSEDGEDDTIDAADPTSVTQDTFPAPILPPPGFC